MTHHVAVIGSGAVGTVSALEILRDGHSVTVIDPGEPGGEQAASYGNAAWFSSHSVIPPSLPGIWRKVPSYLADPLGPLAIRWSYLPKVGPWLWRYLRAGSTEAKILRTGQALRALLLDAPALHHALATEAGVEKLVERRGLLQVYPSRADFEAEALGWRVRKAVGVKWLELDADELGQREPELAKTYKFAVLIEEAGNCRNPGAYVAALADLARSRGATHVRAHAQGFRIEGGRLKAVLTDQGEIACDAAVVAAGARSKPLAAAAGDRVPLESERGYHVMIDAPGGPRTSMMSSLAKMVITTTDLGVRAAGQVEFAGLDAAPNWERAEVLRKHLLAMFPALADAPSDKIRTWMGHRPSTPDGLPCIGPASATPDVVYAFGHGHVGLVGSARTGRLVAQLVGGRPPEIAVTPFDPRRF